jgi:REP element-mobilizing transposase RayT
VARPLRQQDYAGAVHHVFSRGVARSATAVDSADYERALGFLERAVERFELRCHAWCFLPNHFHLLLTSQLGNLSSAMHWLGTCTAQTFNERYERSGHLYQGRFGSKLVEDDEYLLELARYLPLNPVRAGLCSSPEDWPWSSYAATVGLVSPPPFLDSGAFIEILGSPRAYVDWVAQGVDKNRMDEFGAPNPPLSLTRLLADRSDAAIACAHLEHGHSKADIARHLGMTRWQVNTRLARFARLGSGPKGAI